MTSVLLVGQVVPGALTTSLEAAFRDLGCAVQVVPIGPFRRPRLAGLAYRVGALASIARAEIERAVDASVSSRHDLVVVVKGPFVDAALVDRLRARAGGPVVCWNPDSPLDGAISNRGAGMPAAVSAYDAYITWSDDLADRLSSIARRVIVVPFAWDPHLHQPTEGRGVATGRVVFVGSWTRDRERNVAALRAYEPLVFGNGWTRVRGIEVRPAVTDLAFAAVVGEARWNLNFLRPQNATSHNMRTFEIPACRGSQLAQWSPDHERFLGDLPSVALFRTADELHAHLDAEAPSKDVPDEWLSANTYEERCRALLAEIRS